MVMGLFLMSDDKLYQKAITKRDSTRGLKLKGQLIEMTS